MEKIFALIDKLRELKNNGADLDDMTYYTQLLFAELMCAKNNQEKSQNKDVKKISVILPGRQAATPVSADMETSEETLPFSRELPGSSYYRQSANAEPVQVGAPVQTLFDTQPLKHTERSETNGKIKEINEVIANNKPSLNDSLKQEKKDIATKLTETAGLKDLSKAIDINEKFLFINDLFRGDRNMYERSIKTINECSGLDEADYWIGRELKIKLGWQENNDTVKQFYQLVRKRFA